jgi:hypothetical protein
VAHTERRGVRERKKWAAGWEGWAAPFFVFLLFLFLSKLTQINLTPNEI